MTKLSPEEMYLKCLYEDRGIPSDSALANHWLADFRKSLDYKDTIRAMEEYAKQFVPTEDKKSPVGGYQPTNTVDTSNPPRQKAPVLEVENALRSHQDYKDGLKILEKHLGDLYYQCGNMHGDIFEAMQEYASQERNRAIQELSKKLKEGLDNYGCKRDVAGKWVLEDNVFHVLRELIKKDS